MLRRLNLDGDRQADHRVHGGPERAALVYAAAHYPRWAAELGLALEHGSFGESFTVEGIDEEAACIGDVLELGAAVIQVSEARGPCYKVAYRTAVPDMVERIEANGRGGFYVRVLQEGLVEREAAVRLLERPNPDWNIHRARLAYRSRSSRLREVAGLSDNWRRRLQPA